MLDQPLLRVADRFFLFIKFRNDGLPCLVSRLPCLRFLVSASDSNWLLQRILFPFQGVEGFDALMVAIVRPWKALLKVISSYRVVSPSAW